MPINPAHAHLDQKLLGRIPLVVGVTGHRDLRPQDEDRLRGEVQKIFETLRKDYLPDDKDTPIIVLSALAEGADRLVAKEALGQGAILIAPLPMEEEEYREDFRGKQAIRPDAEKDFDALLGCAFASHALPYRPGSSREAVRSNEDKRADQYQDVGIYIVSHCHALIALWNDKEKSPEEFKKGGTAAIVDFKRKGIPIEFSSSARSALDGYEIGPVIHIVTPRAKDPPSPSLTVSVKPWGKDLTGRPTLAQRFFRWLTAGIGKLVGHPPHRKDNDDTRAWRVFAAIAKQTCRFNADTLKYGPAGNPAQSLEWLFEDTKGPPSPRARNTAEKSARYWCALYKLADAVAQVTQRRFIWDWRFLFGLGFLAILTFEIFAHVFTEEWPLLLVYAGLFALAFYWFSYALRHEHQERFLDYRALAESLRVAIYWKLAGIPHPISDAYPIKQPSELAWVKIALRMLDMLHLVDMAPEAPPTLEAQKTVRELWVNGQKRYFKRASEKNHRMAEMRETQSLTALAFSPIVGVFLAYAMFCWHVGHDAQHAMIVVMGSLAGLAAVLAGYTEKLAHHAHARQYDRMHSLFAHALGLVDRSVATASDKFAPIKDIEDLYVELGREAMKENAEWVAIYRQRPIRPAG